VLPKEVPPTLAQLNWDSIEHTLPIRWTVGLDRTLLPEQYQRIAKVGVSTAQPVVGTNPGNPTDVAKNSDIQGTLGDSIQANPTTTKKRKLVKDNN